MLEARLHDGSALEIEVHGEGPTLLLPVDPRPVEGPRADEMRKYGADPALGQSLVEGLRDAFRVVAFPYEAQRRAEIESLGWQVQVLEGLDHIQAMQAAVVAPILREALGSKEKRA